ncbi:unnamed protein product [Penicillium camemberti]|uniref:Str. FM013 n=1 Tax=Penicillium camemberti (strain FM 013) TaxID=1429867 RepID=A0A0G4NX61_PENC3|nr:unnamed protein product [Penicillium camemberti]
MGWYLGPSATAAMTDAQTWTTSGSYAGGCDGNSCTFATNCDNNIILYDDGATGACDSATCVTMTIFETSPYGRPSAINIFCGFSWKANTIYRQLQATTTTEPMPSPTLSTTTSPTGPSPTTTTTSTTADSQASQSPTPTVAATNGSSKAWIAGAGIGPLAGLAIVSALISWWIYRRKQNQPSLSQEQPFISQSPPPKQYAGYPLEPYKQIHELPTTEAPRIHKIGPSGERPFTRS